MQQLMDRKNESYLEKLYFYVRDTFNKQTFKFLENIENTFIPFKITSWNDKADTTRTHLQQQYTLHPINVISYTEKSPG